jgi:uncharacterized protein (TIGR00725 family)
LEIQVSFSVMKLTIGVMGSSSIPGADTERLAFRTGEAIGRAGAVLITGATTGLPLAAARGAKNAGGEVIGFSPAGSSAEHLRLGYPEEFHDLIVYTGLSSHGRNLLNVRASQGLIFVGGSMGALNEFTIAYDEQKVIGIVQGSGGFCNHLEEWMQHLAKPGNRSVMIHCGNPEELVERVLQEIRKQQLGS